MKPRKASGKIIMAFTAFEQNIIGVSVRTIIFIDDDRVLEIFITKPLIEDKVVTATVIIYELVRS